MPVRSPARLHPFHESLAGSDVQVRDRACVDVALERAFEEQSPAGGIEAWREDGQAIEFVATTSAAQAARWRDEGSAVILDVRDPHEREQGHVPGSLHVYVGDLERELPAVGKDERLVVHCSVGHRSGIAASILRRHRYANVHNLLGGMKAWQALGLPLERG